MRTSCRLALIVLAAAPLAAFAACVAEPGVDGDEGEHEESERRGKAHFDPVTIAAWAASAAAIPQSAPVPPGPATGRLAPFDTELPWSYLADWEPTVACSRDGHLVAQMTTRYGDPYSTAQPPVVLRTSFDGGATWQPDQYVNDKGAWEADPQVGIADDGTLFCLWLHNFTPGIKLKKSSDHGKTWTTPIALAPKSPAFPNGWSDKPALVVAPNGQDVFVGFNSNEPWVVVSNDGGKTFGAPIKTAASNRIWFHSGGCVAPNGDFYLVACDYRSNLRGRVFIDVIRSTDQGKTWTTSLIDTSQDAPSCSYAPGCYAGFLGPSISIACDDSGLLLLAYNSGLVAGKPQPMWVRTSTDGVTWSAAQQISVADPNVTNGFPAVAAPGPPGDFRVVWQDDRMLGIWNTWYRQTLDGGATWGPAIQLSGFSLGPPYKSSSGYAFVFGDYLGLAVDDAGVNHVIWGEGASYNGPGTTWYTRGQ